MHQDDTGCPAQQGTHQYLPRASHCPAAAAVGDLKESDRVSLNVHTDQVDIFLSAFMEPEYITHNPDHIIRGGNPFHPAVVLFLLPDKDVPPVPGKGNFVLVNLQLLFLLPSLTYKCSTILFP